MNKKQKRVLFISLVLISLAILGRYMTADAEYKLAPKLSQNEQIPSDEQKYAGGGKNSPTNGFEQIMAYSEAIGAFISRPIPFIPSDDSIWFYSPDTHQTIRAKITAYSSEVEQTDDTPNLTASQTSTRKGVAACPRFIAFGTKISIGGEIYECLDRMAKRFDDRFDIWFSDAESALAWGIQEYDVEIHD